MANQPIQDPRWIVVRPSRLALIINACVGTCAIAVVLYLASYGAFSIGWSLLTIAMLIALVVRQMRRICLRNSSAITAFYLLAIDDKPSLASEPVSAIKAEKLGMRLSYEKQHVVREVAATAHVQATAFVTPWFAAIPYVLERDGWWRKRWPRVLPLWRDSMDAEAFRRLRVQLKWR